MIEESRILGGRVGRKLFYSIYFSFLKFGKITGTSFQGHSLLLSYRAFPLSLLSVLLCRSTVRDRETHTQRMGKAGFEQGLWNIKGGASPGSWFSLYQHVKSLNALLEMHDPWRYFRRPENQRTWL